MKISLGQINSIVGDIKYNYKLIVKQAEIAQKSGAEILITPELGLSGYPPEDLLLNNDFIENCEIYLKKISKKFPNIKIIVGYPRKYKGLLFNSASILYKGQIQKTYDKQILPNYGVFDEKRYFNPGKKSLIFTHKKYKFGLLICEDIWIKGPAEELIKNKVNYIVCINASPYEINKRESRLQEIKKRIPLKGPTIIYLNLVGGQDDLLFDGGSFVYNKKDGLLCELPQFQSINTIIETEIIKKIQKKVSKNKTQILLDGLVLALKDYLEKNTIKNIFIGLSGGIDSAIVLYIASIACKKENITTIMMPSQFTSRASLEDANQLAQTLGVTYKIRDIQLLTSSFDKSLASDFKGLTKDIAEENIQARVRGVLLMAYANKFDGIVLATNNKSEVAVGYSTVYGDMVGGFSVLKDIPKTMVYQLAKHINMNEIIIPTRIINRAPSAELRDNQTDQDSLPSYHILDGIIDLYIEKNETQKMIINKGYSSKIVKNIINLIHRNEFKRRQTAPGPKITSKAFSRDRRFPITNNFK